MKNYHMLVVKEAYKDLKALSGKKGYYVPLVKNIKLIDIELEALELIKTKTKDFEEFLKEKEKVLIKYSKKDDNGKPVKGIEEVDGVSYYKYDIPEESKEAMEKEGKELIEKYTEVITEMRNRELKYVEEMNAECTVAFHKIKEEDLPVDMSPELFEIIEEFL